MTDPAELLARSQTIAVVGFSRDPRKAVHSAPAELIPAGFTVIPVNPHATEVAGQPAYRSLAEVPVPIDIVNVFRPSEFAPEFAARAVEVGAKAGWLQTGIRSAEARRIATDAGLDYVEDTCIAVVRAANGLVRA